MNSKLILVLLFLGGIVIMAFKADTGGKKKVVFFGDSITQAGVQPKGYITVLANMLSNDHITNYDLVGAGIGGNKIYDLYLRMEDDVISKSPDIVVVYVGVNDVWHKKTSGTGTDADKFEKFYRALIAKLQAAGAKVIVCTPATIGEKNDNSNELDGDLNKYSNIIRSMAADLHIPLVDLRKAFSDYEVANNSANTDKGILTSDGVHLNDKGNEMVAKLMWETIKTVQ
ncbi:SGNH/GDSL hydrolase family protein [Limnovirga soli]|uniref:G-D-S-L family lipolytic protein n=1 Tax=Limnovirga soli TaxID=2656915 RepID=A0A8J8FCL8_9BACT|nr:GDSL-type esterase/lipase family protein [Limnovirga soli]NNV55590.1 G-D-S-L family lipolytic protein [Limnovirga soli]